MTWRVTKVEEERQEFIRQVHIGTRTFTDLCQEFQVSRKTGYKWVHRYEEYGEEGLNDRSRRPHSQPGKTNEELIRKILEVKQRYPSWGPKKILALLAISYPSESWPSDTTIGNILLILQ